jgi:DMSO/TMAO reductase YedYZ molybdopterin-dependent catalytic subunit
MPIVSRGFRGRRSGSDRRRLPPGQYLESDFPVLHIGATPRVARAEYELAITGEIDAPRRWTFDALTALPVEEVVRDIHCVTKWSKLDTTWRGVSVDTLLDGADTGPARHVVMRSYDGYTTNLPLADLTGGKAWVTWEFESEPLDPEHGGPVRLLVPHLYFWKSAKWVTELELRSEDEPGFWERGGYHNYGDPWLEQRYQGD